MIVVITKLMASVYLFLVLLLGLVTEANTKPYGLSVSSVGATSAVLHWHSTETTVEEFKGCGITIIQIECSGTRHYETEHGEEQKDLDSITHYATKGSDHVLIGNLKENFNYSCVVTEDIKKGTQVLGDRASDPYYFATDYGAPEQPKTPVVHVLKGNVVKIDLFQTSTKFGPIDGYEVQFHVVKGWTSDNEPFVDPEEMEIGQLMSVDEARETVGPVSFKLHYNSSTLPTTVTISDDLLDGALKSGVMYSVINMAYTVIEEAHNSTAYLSTGTAPSTTFTPVGHGPIASSLPLESGSSTQLTLAIGLGVALPLVILGYFFCVGAFIYCREMRLRKRKMYTRSDILEARKTQRQENSSWYEAATEGDLPWLDPLAGNSNRQTLLNEESQESIGQAPIGQRRVSVIAEVHEYSEGDTLSNRQLPYISNGMCGVDQPQAAGVSTGISSEEISMGDASQTKSTPSESCCIVIEEYTKEPTEAVSICIENEITSTDGTPTKALKYEKEDSLSLKDSRTIKSMSNSSVDLSDSVKTSSQSSSSPMYFSSNNSDLVQQLSARDISSFNGNLTQSDNPAQFELSVCNNGSALHSSSSWPSASSGSHSIIIEEDFPQTDFFNTHYRLSDVVLHQPSRYSYSIESDVSEVSLVDPYNLHSISVPTVSKASLNVSSSDEYSMNYNSSRFNGNSGLSALSHHSSCGLSLCSIGILSSQDSRNGHSVRSNPSCIDSTVSAPTLNSLKSTFSSSGTASKSSMSALGSSGSLPSSSRSGSAIHSSTSANCSSGSDLTTPGSDLKMSASDLKRSSTTDLKSSGSDLNSSGSDLKFSGCTLSSGSTYSSGATGLSSEATLSSDCTPTYTHGSVTSSGTTLSSKAGDLTSLPNLPSRSTSSLEPHVSYDHVSSSSGSQSVVSEGVSSHSSANEDCTPTNVCRVGSTLSQQDNDMVLSSSDEHSMRCKPSPSLPPSVSSNSEKEMLPSRSISKDSLETLSLQSTSQNTLTLNLSISDSDHLFSPQVSYNGHSSNDSLTQHPPAEYLSGNNWKSSLLNSFSEPSVSSDSSFRSTKSVLSSHSNEYQSATDCTIQGHKHCTCKTKDAGMNHDGAVHSDYVHVETGASDPGILQMSATSSESLFIPRILSCKSLHRAMSMPHTPSLVTSTERSDSDQSID